MTSQRSRSSGLGWPDAADGDAVAALGWPAGPLVSASAPQEIVSRETSAGETEVAQSPSDNGASGDHGMRSESPVSRETAPAAAGQARATPAGDADEDRQPGSATQTTSAGQTPGAPQVVPIPETTAAPQADDAPAASSPKPPLNSPGSVTRETEAPPALPTQQSREITPPVPPPPPPQITGEQTATSADVAPARTRRVEAWPLPPRTRVITVANQKGGVGKTTSAVNLAAALSEHGARVLVIDLDPQGNASTAFGLDHREGTDSVYDVLVDGRPIAEVASQVEGFPTLRCVPATIDVAGAEVELVPVVARETRLRKAVNAAIGDYDYILIDCPPSLGLLTVNALVAAQEVLIPIQCEFYALEGLTQLLRNIELVRGALNESLSVSTILLTMYDARTRLADQVANDVRDHFGDLVVDVVIPRSVRISEAPGFGQTVIRFDPASRGAKAYVQAAHIIARRGADATDAPAAE